MTHIPMRRATFLGAALVLALGAAACSPDGASDGTTAIAGPGATGPSRAIAPGSPSGGAGSRATVNPPPDGLAGYDVAQSGISFSDPDGNQVQVMPLVDANGNISYEHSLNGQVIGRTRKLVGGTEVSVNVGGDAFEQFIAGGPAAARGVLEDLPALLTDSARAGPRRQMSYDMPCQAQTNAYVAAATALVYGFPRATTRQRIILATAFAAAWQTLYDCWESYWASVG